MNRIIRSVAPSYPWMWMAILSGSPNQMNPANSEDSTKGLVNAAKQVAKFADFGSKLLSGDLSTFLPALTGMFEDDMLFSSLIKSVDLPTFGHEYEFSDLGFVRYPHASQVRTEGFTIDFLETQDSTVSRYMHAWQNQICPSVGKVNSNSVAGGSLVNVTQHSEDVGIPGTKSSANLAAFRPLAAAARTLYIIKLRRSTLLAMANLLIQAGSDAMKGIWSIQSGIYETPAQVYCFPQVVPQTFKESKLDKSESNSLSTVSVRMERVPILRYPIETGSSGEYGKVSKEMVFLSGVLGAFRALDSLTDTILGFASTTGAIIGTARNVSGIYSQSQAHQLVKARNRPEAYDDPVTIDLVEP